MVAAGHRRHATKGIRLPDVEDVLADEQGAGAASLQPCYPDVKDRPARAPICVVDLRLTLIGRFMIPPGSVAILLSAPILLLS